MVKALGNTKPRSSQRPVHLHDLVLTFPKYVSASRYGDEGRKVGEQIEFENLMHEQLLTYFNIFFDSCSPGTVFSYFVFILLCYPLF